jgi:hypothetical protein
MVYTTLDTDGQRVDCERLLLPFGSPDGSVKQLLASMAVISLTRNVVLSKALNQFERSHEIAFAGGFGHCRATTARRECREPASSK